jgi:hypothetical protein
VWGIGAVSSNRILSKMSLTVISPLETAIEILSQHYKVALMSKNADALGIVF